MRLSITSFKLIQIIEAILARFILKCFYFIIIGGILIGPFCYLSRTTYIRSLNDSVFLLSKDTNILIAGDSHLEMTVNPDLLPHSANISISGENYFYTYYKLRHFLARNPQVSTVVLGFSWHNFPKKYQESFLFGEERSKVEQYFPLLDREGKLSVFNFKSSYLVPWFRYTLGLPLKLYLDQVLSRSLLGQKLSRESFTFYGGYKLNNKSVIDKVKTNEKLKAYYQDEYGVASESSSLMIDYLDKILKMCMEKNVRVVLFNTPVQNDYLEGIPTRSIKSLDTIRSNLLSKHSNVIYIDYSNFTLPTNYFYDSDHVNSYGASIVTQSLQLILDDY